MNVGGKRFTTREALDRFVHRTTAAANPDLSAQVSKRRLRALEQAERELDRAGI
jgi:type VI protein secretion system component VasF